MPSKLIQKSKALVSAVSFSALLLTSGLLNAAPPQPEFNIEAIGPELMEPGRFAPAHACVFASRGAADPLADLKKEKEKVLGELKKIASVDETGHLRSGGQIQMGKEKEYISLLQQHGNLCIEFNYAQEMETHEAENLPESGKISDLLQNGQRYLNYVHTLSCTLPGLYDLSGRGQPFQAWEMQWSSPQEDDNFLALIGGKKNRKILISLQLLKKDMDTPQHLVAAQDPQYMRSPARMLEAIYTILEAETYEQAQVTLDHMVAWMADFKEFTETTKDGLKALKLEKRKLIQDNDAFMKRLEIFKKGDRLEEVDGAMVPYFKSFGLIPMSTEFLKVEPTNVQAVESVIKESFVLKSQALRAEIEAKEKDFTLYEKITNYILDIEDYLSKKGRLS